ncbi:MAG: membrane fusion protein (multidrug efflux system) [Myxococcota bacterium]|jgi:membrane fusion protein (multidrug efflux system)
MRLWTAAVVAVALVACGGDGDGWDGEGGGEPSAPEPVTVVETAVAGRGEVADTLQASAIVESLRQADLVPSATGRVIEVRVDDGDRVLAGDVLAVLENVSLDASAARTGVEARRLTQQVAELEALHSRGAVSDKDLEDARFQLRTAQLSASEASRSQGETRLTAPFDGVVASRQIRVGELAGSGQAAFQVVDLDALRVVASMPERDLPRVRAGQTARLTSAYDDEVWTSGVVDRVAPVVDPTSGTFRVTISVEAGQRTLRPGQFVTIDLEVGRERDVLTVPKRALVYEDGAPVVFVVGAPDPEEEDPEDGGDEEGDEAGGWWPPAWWPFGGEDAEEEAEDADADAAEEEVLVARRQSVRLGLIDDESAQVLEGVEDGASVIVVGQAHLRDGARVRHPRTDAEPEGADVADGDAAVAEEPG